MKRVFCLLFAAALGFAADKYDGPKPPKDDVPYLLHASNLIATEKQEAKRESGKNADTYLVSGASSTARTPLAEPIFMIQAERLSPERIELYRFDSKGGQRAVTLSKRKGGKVLRLTVRRLEGRLWRIEAAEPLENGEYALMPDGSDVLFCFQVY